MHSQRIIKNSPSKPGTSDVPSPNGEDVLTRVLIADGNNVPVIECIKSGEIVTHIDVTCTCGQVTRVVCEYPNQE